ncbi:MAG: hypothetical protein E7K68_03490, partial [Corynebacterium kroppenstedtii]|nr:hypothetical protein [Corynebacterium kroppenstedtii]
SNSRSRRLTWDILAWVHCHQLCDNVIPRVEKVLARLSKLVRAAPKVHRSSFVLLLSYCCCVVHGYP